MFKDLFKLTQDQNRRYARMNIIRLIHTESRFEGVNTTLTQTQTIIDGLEVDGVPIEDINVIVQLKRGWNLIINSDEPIDLKFAQKINKIVAAHESLAPGEFRTGTGTVNTLNGEFIPQPVNLPEENSFLSRLFTGKASNTSKSLTLMYHLMRNQIFWDGNKRTATLLANKFMIDHGAGLINVPLDKWSTWNQLISDYYQSGQIIRIKKWTYQNSIQGSTFDMQPNNQKITNYSKKRKKFER